MFVKNRWKNNEESICKKHLAVFFFNFIMFDNKWEGFLSGLNLRRKNSWSFLTDRTEKGFEKF